MLHMSKEPNLQSIGTNISQAETLHFALEKQPLRHSFAQLSLHNNDKYETLAFLGEGGMGYVYKAKDQQLKRLVALKFIHRSNQTLLESFLNEARIQASLTHKNICKVYEVGELAGEPYIAMQYIEGLSLKEAATELTLEAKIKIIKDVAEALQVAHKQGLIHRDIKPANIMIERSDEGGWHPYIMDFGLAREVEGDNKTATGVIMGTPAYMSPEQALGKRQLDRRTDIYSLGATLYDLLAGTTPFNGATGLEIILKVVREDAVPLSSLEPKLPLDLETIVMKCLEKEPSQRYESAKALAEDLQHYLAGEPIAARRASLRYRTTKWAQKHKTAVRAIIIVSLITGLLTTISLRNKWIYGQKIAQAQQQTRIAQRFGEQIKEMESILRYAYMLPVHDTSREREIVAARIQLLNKQIKELGEVGIGPGHYALGRAEMALQNYPKAYEDLQLAWQHGYQEPEVGQALGQVLGELYYEALSQLPPSKDREAQEARKQELIKTYRDPALKYLRAANTSLGATTAYEEGLIAFYEERYPEALKKAEQAFEHVPWLYEAKRLQGDIFLAQAEDKASKGEYDEAHLELTNANAVYQLAMTIARSDAALYESEAARLVKLIEIDNAQGQLSPNIIEQALAACDMALKINPQSAIAYIRKSQVYSLQAEYYILHGGDMSSLGQKAIEMAQQAIERAPKDFNAYNALGKAAGLIFFYRIEHGLDYQQVQELTLNSFQQAVKLNPGVADIYNSLGLTYSRIAQENFKKGPDVYSISDQAIKAFQQAIEINPTFADAYKNLASHYNLLARYEMDRGGEPQKYFEQSIQNYQKALQINPKFNRAYNNLSVVYEDIAEYQLQRGRDPQAAISSNIKINSEVLQRDPTYYFAYNRIGLAYMLLASYQSVTGKDPTESFNSAYENYQKALSIAPDFAKGYINLSLTYRNQAQHLLRKHEDPTTLLAQARKALNRSVEINPTAYYIGLEQCQIELVAVHWAIINQQSPLNFFEKAQEGLKRSKQANPNEALNYQLEANLYAYKAEWFLSQGRVATTEIHQGQEIAAHALMLNPQSAETLAIQGLLLILQANEPSQLETRSELLKAAQAKLVTALQKNALLKPDYNEYLAKTGQLK